MSFRKTPWFCRYNPLQPLHFDFRIPTQHILNRFVENIGVIVFSDALRLVSDALKSGSDALSVISDALNSVSDALSFADDALKAVRPLTDSEGSALPRKCIRRRGCGDEPSITLEKNEGKRRNAAQLIENSGVDCRGVGFKG